MLEKVEKKQVLSNGNVMFITGYYNDEGSFVTHSFDDEPNEVMEFYNANKVSTGFIKHTKEHGKLKDGLSYHRLLIKLDENDVEISRFEEKHYYKDGLFHNDRGPALIVLNDNGDTVKEYYLNGEPSFSVNEFGYQMITLNSNNEMVSFLNEDGGVLGLSNVDFLGVEKKAKEYIYSKGGRISNEALYIVKGSIDLIKDLYLSAGINVNISNVSREAFTENHKDVSLKFMTQKNGYNVESVVFSDNVCSVVVSGKGKNKFYNLFTIIDGFIVRVNNKVEISDGKNIKTCFANVDGLEYNIDVKNNFYELTSFKNYIDKQVFIRKDKSFNEVFKELLFKNFNHKNQYSIVYKYDDRKLSFVFIFKNGVRAIKIDFKKNKIQSFITDEVFSLDSYKVDFDDNLNYSIKEKFSNEESGV